MGSMKRKLVFSALVVLIVLAVSFGLVRLFEPVHITVRMQEKSPLSALVSIQTKNLTQVSIRVAGKHNNDIEVRFPNFARDHEIPILGLYPNFNNTVELVFTTDEGVTFSRQLRIKTKPLPPMYPRFSVERLEPDQISPGMIFLQLGHYDEAGSFTSLPTAIDDYGQVRWYYIGEIGHVMKRLPNGNLLIQGSRQGSTQDNLLLEIDMLGRTVAIRAEVQTGIHHDVSIMPNGNLLVLSTAPNSFEDGVVEVDAKSGEVVQWWDFRAILDPSRPPQPRNLEKRDWLHLNGIDYDPLGDTFVVSGRDQSAVAKIDRKSGKLVWILGNHEFWPESLEPYLLKPVGETFEWQWGQHAPMVHPEIPGRLLVYDNGNERSYDSPVTVGDNYSRAVEFQIDERSMQVRQVWQFGKENGSETFTPFIGDANYLPNGNRLVCFGGITRSLDGQPMEIFDFAAGKINRMKISAQIVEVTADSPAREVLRISIADPNSSSYRGYRSYQAEKYPLYY